MLVLTRKANQRVVINGDIEVIVLSVSGERVRLGFLAPRDVPIYRNEIQERIDVEGQVPSPLTTPPCEAIP